MKDNKPLWSGLVVAAVALIVLVVAYANTSRELTEAENQVQQLQAQVGGKDTKIKELEGNVASAEDQVENWERENKQLRDNVETLGNCIDGVKNVGQAETIADVMILIGKMDEPCTKSEAILNKLRAERGTSQ